MKKLITILLALLFTSSVYAQDEEKPEINFLKFTRSKFMLLDRDMHVIKTKLSDNDMNALLEGHTDELKRYNRFKRLRTLKRISLGVFAGSFVTALGTSLYNDRHNDDSYNNDELSWIIAGAGVAQLLVIRIPISVAAGTNASKAVDGYNGYMHKQKEKYSLNLRVTPNGFGLAFNF